MTLGNYWEYSGTDWSDELKAVINNQKVRFYLKNFFQKHITIIRMTLVVSIYWVHTTLLLKAPLTNRDSGSPMESPWPTILSLSDLKVCAFCIFFLILFSLGCMASRWPVIFRYYGISYRDSFPTVIYYEFVLQETSVCKRIIGACADNTSHYCFLLKHKGVLKHLWQWNMVTYLYPNYDSSISFVKW